MSDDSNAEPSAASGLPVAVTGDLSLSADKPILVYETEIPIRWADMDAQRHVNNVMYFRYLEQCRIDWIDAMDVRSLSSEDGPVVVNAYCSFLRQLRFPGSVLARLSVAQFGRSSVMTFVDLLRTDDPDTVYAAGGAKLVWINYAREKSVPLPAPVRERMSRPMKLISSG